ncbi:MAG TPA: histidine phosphatase family protein [Actinomycetales bacterium]|nr:histidine phosphatase family protein [Actinomycetales bacterium]
MPTVLLVRHGRSTANTGGVLAGWTPGVELDEQGRSQATALANRLGVVPLAAVVSSPLERCVSTADALAAVEGTAGRSRPAVQLDDRLGECRYGDWTGRELKSLAKDPLWKVVQTHPSAAVFPGPDGESLRGMQLRALDAVRDWDARLAAENGDDAIWVAVSHGDVIKALVADAVGAHLDAFQRVVVDPCSVTAIRYTSTRPFLLRCNDTGGELASLVTPTRRRRRSRRTAVTTDSDAVVGGSTGT